MPEYELRVIKTIVVPKGEPIYSECATSIEIRDNAPGEYVQVSQEGGNKDLAKCIVFDTQEWVAVRDAIDRAIANCRGSAD